MSLPVSVEIDYEDEETSNKYNITRAKKPKTKKKKKGGVIHPQEPSQIDLLEPGIIPSLINSHCYILTMSVISTNGSS